jgi:aspartyl-tRNA(Asn)/glutamyl-tRNA(Gln) amidotransferase subunit A
MARDVAGLSMLLGVIAGHDPRDGTSSVTDKKAYHASSFKAPRTKLKVALLRESMEAEGTQPAVQQAIRDAVLRLEEFDTVVEEVSVASLKFALAAYYIIAMAEASSNLARYDGVRYGGKRNGGSERGREDWNAAYSRTRSELFGAEVKRRILLGTFALSAGYSEAYYVKAQKVRTILRKETEKVFKRFDLLVGPTMPVLPPRLAQKMTPLEEYAMDVDTVPANLVGLPAISVPCGSRRGLPIGLQLTAPHFREDLLLETAHAYESLMSHG